MVIRDALCLAMYTGLLREEVLTLNWKHIDREARTLRVRHTRGTVSSEFPVTTHLAEILDRRHAACGRPEPGRRGWGFPSWTNASGHLTEIKRLYPRISETAGTKFWFQGMRNCCLAVAERDLQRPARSQADNSIASQSVGLSLDIPGTGRLSSSANLLSKSQIEFNCFHITSHPDGTP